MLPIEQCQTCTACFWNSMGQILVEATRSHSTMVRTRVFSSPGRPFLDGHICKLTGELSCQSFARPGHYITVSQGVCLLIWLWLSVGSLKIAVVFVSVSVWQAADIHRPYAMLSRATSSHTNKLSCQRQEVIYCKTVYTVLSCSSL
jgi:hypothetical protein